MPDFGGRWRHPTALAGLAAVTLLSGFVLVRQWTAPYRPGPEAVQWYERGTAALNDGTFYKAGKALEQAVAFDDRFALGHARLAEAWAELDYVDKASREILRAQSLARESSLSDLDSLRVQAITHVVLREFDQAITAYESLTQLVPAAEKPGAYVDLGRAQEQDDRIKEAEESYTKATTLATQDPAAYLRLGILRGRQQDLEGAVRALQTAEKLYQALSNVEGEAEVFYQRAFLFKNLNRLRDAKAQAEQALTLSSRPDNPFQQIRTLLVLSGVAAAEGRSSEAEAQATRAIELARTHGMENQATNGLVWLGNVFLSRGDYSQAEAQYTRALELARRDNGRLNEAVALFSLGSLRSQQRKTDDALRLVQEALPFFQRAGHRKWLAVALTLLGRVHRDRGEYDAALRAFNEQLRIGARVGDASQEAVVHTEIGSVLKRQERYPEALDHFDKSATISTSLNAKVSVGYALMERAGVLWQLGRFDDAKSALDEATANAGPEGAYKGLLAEIHLARARLYLSAGRFPASKVESQRAIDLAADQYSDIATEAAVTLGLAETRSGNARAAVRSTQKTVTMATDTGDPLLLSSARLALAEALLSVGDAKSSLETARLAQESFARFGQLDSEWRAWLIEAESTRRLGQVAAARECAAAAAARLASLEQRLGPDSYAGFATRPDVLEFHRRLHHQLNP
jgi:tetratricopeptide (TPR) repeat protein